MLGKLSISECFSEYDFMVIQIVKKASAPNGGTQNRESPPVEDGINIKTKCEPFNSESVSDPKIRRLTSTESFYYAQHLLK